jgi:hypothetical protein
MVAVTDPQGVFVLEGLVPGPVMSAVVKAPGYVSASFSAFPPPGNPWPDVAAGETQEVKVDLVKGGVVRGVVRHKESGAAVAGAEVTVMGEGWQAMASLWVGTPGATSGSDGSYEVQGVPPGKYRLHALAEGLSPAAGTQGVEVEVPAEGGVVEKDLFLSDAGRVAGRVLDLAGEPVAAARVRLELRQGRGQGQGMPGAGRMAETLIRGVRPSADLTDADGRFDLGRVVAGARFVVVAESDAYVGAESEPFEVAAGERREVDLTLVPGGTLRGRVVDENGRWLRGARVRLGPLPEDMTGETAVSGWRADRALLPETWTTAEDGSFLATNLPSGRLLLKVEAEGYVTHYKRSLSIQPGEVRESFVVPLSKGETIEGVVRGADGRPLEGATVGVTTQKEPGNEAAGTIDEEATAADDVEPTLWARTDAQGRYRVEQVPPARRVNVLVWFAPGHQGWRRPGATEQPTEAQEKAIRREVRPPARDLDFRLDRAEAGPFPSPPPPPAGGRQR